MHIEGWGQALTEPPPPPLPWIWENYGALPSPHQLNIHVICALKKSMFVGLKSNKLYNI